MKNDKNAIKLPRFLHRYFWDVNVNSIDPEREKTFILSRLLDKGNVEAVRWVRENFSPQEIRVALRNYKDFSLRTASFLATLYQVPLTQVKCFQEPYLTTRKKLWPY